MGSTPVRASYFTIVQHSLGHSALSSHRQSPTVHTHYNTAELVSPDSQAILNVPNSCTCIGALEATGSRVPVDNTQLINHLRPQMGLQR
jgi:hypothetical protein